MKTLLSHDAVLENITVHPSEGRSLICGKYILVISSTASKIVHKEVVETLRRITGEKCNDWSTLVRRFDLKIPLAMILLNQSRSGGNKLKLFQLLCPTLELFLGILFMSLWSTLKCAKVKKKEKKKAGLIIFAHTSLTFRLHLSSHILLGCCYDLHQSSQSLVTQESIFIFNFVFSFLPVCVRLPPPGAVPLFVKMYFYLEKKIEELKITVRVCVSVSRRCYRTLERRSHLVKCDCDDCGVNSLRLSISGCHGAFVLLSHLHVPILIFFLLTLHVNPSGVPSTWFIFVEALPHSVTRISL